MFVLKYICNDYVDGDEYFETAVNEEELIELYKELVLRNFEVSTSRYYNIYTDFQVYKLVEDYNFEKLDEEIKSINEKRLQEYLISKENTKKEQEDQQYKQYLKLKEKYGDK